MKLKIGDRIRIISVPGKDNESYVIHPETVIIYEKLIKRNRFVTISEIDEDGTPWFTYMFKNKNGTLKYHFLSVCASDNNWIRVRQKSALN